MNSNTQNMPIFFPPELFIGSKQITSEVKFFNKKPQQPYSQSQIKHQLYPHPQPKIQTKTQTQTNKLSNKNYKLNIIKFRHYE